MIANFIFRVLLDFGLAFVVGFCWGILFGSPKRILWIAGLLGAAGHSLRFVLQQTGTELLAATMISSVTIGLIGIYCAHKVHHPPVVFTMPAFITMIPGLYAYRTMLGCIKLTDPAIIRKTPDIMTQIGHNLMLTLSLLAILAIGISIAALLFRSQSVKDINFGKRQKKN
ncbi:MAG: hypothetical protein H6Q17_355 [Bacteroidetes bacterium]|jgi:uncharacterized membrane protein YjjB (DUF3815 family)|nr:hypothetical protein [Bacteroidota bacterium]